MIPHKPPRKIRNARTPTELTDMFGMSLDYADGDDKKLRAAIRGANRLQVVRMLPSLATVLFLAVGVVFWVLAPGHGAVPPWYSAVPLLAGGGAGTLAGHRSWKRWRTRVEQSQPGTPPD